MANPKTQVSLETELVMELRDRKTGAQSYTDVIRDLVNFKASGQKEESDRIEAIEKGLQELTEWVNFQIENQTKKEETKM